MKGAVVVILAVVVFGIGAEEVGRKQDGANVVPYHWPWLKEHWNRWYVSPFGDDGNGGRRPDRAFQTFQRAVEAADSGDVIVAEFGSYGGTGNVNLDITKDVRIQARDGDIVTVACSSRSEIGWIVSDAKVEIAGITFDTCNPAILSRSFETITLRNVTLARQNTGGSSVRGGKGVDASSSDGTGMLVLEDSVLEESSLYLEGIGGLEMRRTRVFGLQDPDATMFYGVVWLFDVPEITIAESIFEDMTIQQVVFSDARRPTMISVSDTLFRDVKGYGVSQGGAIRATGALADVELRILGCNFTGMRNLGIAERDGGAVHGSSDVNVLVEDSVFLGNEATYGGAMDCWGPCTVKSSEFESNVGVGSVVYCQGGN
eukprot:CAMPEP_0119135638 /NCGR_PEP_ID=MMETSP1310-20130426/19701_1 /TAXON_ID=464262 /ORGANISM="Genus nov. species nov., Strain RCC2339" /LENGTH=372 /DNA_ID=CAMNT_0007126545 /DNA_START=24 /DNA_END=1139 /DNA_ORIENTATION=+